MGRGPKLRVTPDKGGVETGTSEYGRNLDAYKTRTTNQPQNHNVEMCASAAKVHLV